MQNIFIILSVIFGLITPIIGFISIYKGQYKPHRVTRLVLLIISSITFFSLLSIGATSAIWLAGIQLLSNLAMFILAIKFGMGGQSKFDFGILLLALVTVIIWQTTQNPFLALFLSILVDAIGASPTMFKCFTKPDTEDPKFYTSDIISSGFSVLAIATLTLFDYAYPVYLFLVNLLCLSLIFFGKKFIQNSPKIQN